MRRLIRILLAFAMRALAIAVLLGAAGAVTLVGASAALPDLSSESRIEAELRDKIEGARTTQAHQTPQKASPFAVDEALPLSVAGRAFLADKGCAGVERSSPESRSAFRLRLIQRLLRNETESGVGRCELLASEALLALIAPDLSRGQRLLGVWRIREALSFPRLLADWESSNAFLSAGPFGLDEAADRFFGKPAPKLDWSESATLAVASDNYEEVETCRYPPKLKSLRDPLLERLALVYPAEEKAILAAKDQKLPCERPPTPPSGQVPLR